MRGSWKTTLWGSILGVLMGLQTYGVKIGRVGQGDYLGLGTAIAAGMLGKTAKDGDVTGGRRQNPNK